MAARAVRNMSAYRFDAFLRLLSRIWATKDVIVVLSKLRRYMFSQHAWFGEGFLRFPPLAVFSVTKPLRNAAGPLGAE